MSFRLHRLRLQDRYEPRAEAASRAPTGTGWINESLSSIGIQKPDSVRVLRGGFSSYSYALEVPGHAEPLVLRAAYRPLDSLQTEIDVMMRAGISMPVPKAITRALPTPISGLNFALISFVPGTLFDDAEILDAGNWTALARDLGSKLASLHLIRFERPGFFGPGLTSRLALGSLSAGFMHHSLRCIESPALQARLDPGLRKRCENLIRGSADLYSRIDSETCLSHSDFNAKNILVAQGGASVSGILDWEFAFAGSRFVDLGNFLRFSDDMDPLFFGEFCSAYAKGSGGIDPRSHLREAALCDMTALLGFLAADDAPQRTWRTASKALERELRIVGSG